MNTRVPVIILLLLMMGCTGGKNPVGNAAGEGDYTPQFVLVPKEEYTHCDETIVVAESYEIMPRDVTVGEYERFLSQLLADKDLQVEEFLDYHVVRGPYGGDDYYEAGQYPYYYTRYDLIWYDGSSFVAHPDSVDVPIRYVSGVGAHAFSAYYGYRLPSLDEWYAALVLTEAAIESKYYQMTSTVHPEALDHRASGLGLSLGCSGSAWYDMTGGGSNVSFRCVR